MRKIISAALMAATLFGTLGMASSASAQDWGPRHGWEARHDGGWRGDGWRRDGWRGGYGDWQARRDWQMRHDGRCRWDRCW